MDAKLTRYEKIDFLGEGQVTIYNIETLKENKKIIIFDFIVRYRLQSPGHCNGSDSGSEENQNR